MTVNMSSHPWTYSSTYMGMHSCHEHLFLFIAGMCVAVDCETHQSWIHVSSETSCATLHHSEDGFLWLLMMNSCIWQQWKTGRFKCGGRYCAMRIWCSLGESVDYSVNQIGHNLTRILCCGIWFSMGPDGMVHWQVTQCCYAIYVDWTHYGGMCKNGSQFSVYRCIRIIKKLHSWKSIWLLTKGVIILILGVTWFGINPTGVFSSLSTLQLCATWLTSWPSHSIVVIALCRNIFVSLGEWTRQVIGCA